MPIYKNSIRLLNEGYFRSNCPIPKDFVRYRTAIQTLHYSSFRESAGLIRADLIV